MARTITFLTYLSRSGSTYLASKLSEFAEIGVGIEADFIDGWIAPGFTVDSLKQLDSYLDTLYEGYKFCQWRIDRNLLESNLKAYSFPILFGQIIFEVLSLYFQQETVSVMVHKGGHYYRAVNQIREELPTAKFVFIDRDPRAVFSSMRRSLDSVTQKPMLEDILHFTFGYLDTQKKIRQFAGASFFYLVRYEKLLKNESKEIQEILNFLGVGNKKDEKKLGYFDVVPDNQKHLHQNVSSGKPDITRKDGWKEELGAADIRFLEIVLKKHLNLNGYRLSGMCLRTFPEKVHLITNLLKFYYESVKRTIFSLRHKY